jgi:erythromycin esterase-like protein
MKNLFVATTLGVALMGTSVAFAEELPSSGKQLSAFDGVQSFSASSEDLKVAGAGVTPPPPGSLTGTTTTAAPPQQPKPPAVHFVSLK